MNWGHELRKKCVWFNFVGVLRRKYFVFLSCSHTKDVSCTCFPRISTEWTPYSFFHNTWCILYWRGLLFQLFWRFQDCKRVLSNIKAASVGVSVKLDQDVVSLRNTVVGHTATRTVLMSNVGDVAVKWVHSHCILSEYMKLLASACEHHTPSLNIRWNIFRYTWSVGHASFTIAPAEGLIVPETSVPLTVSYKPDTHENNFTCQVSLHCCIWYNFPIFT